MISHRMAQETFNAVMQARAKRCRVDRSDAIDEALHQLRVNSRPAQRPRYDDDDLQDDGKFRRSDWREDPGEDYSLRSYRSSSPAEREEDYYPKNYAHPTTRNREYDRLSSVKRDYSTPSSRDEDYVRPASRERDYSRVPTRDAPRIRKADYTSPELLSEFRSPGLLEEAYGAQRNRDYDLDYKLKPEPEREFSPALRGGRGRGLRGKRGMVASGMLRKDMAAPIRKWNTKPLSLPEDSPEDSANQPKPRLAFAHRPHLSQRPTLGPFRNVLDSMKIINVKEPDLEHIDPSDIFATFGVEIIKWAGFNQIKRDPEYSELHRVLFTLETETCAKILASFKCSLKPEHRDFCFFVVKRLNHAALKTPKLDNKFLNLLLEKKVVMTKNCFFEVIKPFDQFMMRLQDCLLKSTTPLLMACNAYELSTKTSSFNDPAQMASAFETTVSLCRKSLALLGQTFALASTFRQEKILEAVGLQEVAPPPTMFPNFDTHTLFGREYMENLESWLETSGHQMQLKKPAAEPPAPNQRNVPEGRPKLKIPQRADRKVVETIEKLVNSTISGTLTGKEKFRMKGDPEYWFLHEEESLEHKYYKLKLAEMERLMSPAKEESQEKKTPEQRAMESVRTLLYVRKIASIKKRLFRRKRPGLLQRGARVRKVKKSTVGTQTLLSAGTMLKQQALNTLGPATLPSSSLGEARLPEEAPSPREAPDTGSLLGLPENSESAENEAVACQFPGVDAKTMETAEKLAEFVAQFGPEIEQFSTDNSADNPDLWFLQDRESSAFEYYRTKVYELCPSIDFDAVQETRLLEGEEEEEEEEAELEEEGSAAEMGAEESEEEEGQSSADVAEGAAKAEDSGVAEDGQAEGSAPGLSIPASGLGPEAPFQRKRISSKSLRVGLIPSKRICLIQEPEVHEPVRIAYDRPQRRVPFKKKKSKDLEFRQNRLTQKNIGFQMLQKMGWKEGRGLGLQGSGIKEPIKVNPTAGEGLGVAGKKNRDDNFDVFRQRMIQMYNLKKFSK
ncbi:SURP and G-patch domain-containing protein 2 isoform X2 [Hemicordylus capensis]|uniref:SURP and G-patch domain-containing protein 2 isoform X2 n=1 Tax=Hemicordylus capensis TaxID=884348 RepID=UPI0023020A84|nr:SURP and G-patch domain-containing protein 2 isoform X2 [Hemicordylus capensis]